MKILIQDVKKIFHVSFSFDVIDLILFILKNTIFFDKQQLNFFLLTCVFGSACTYLD
jgi:hypothetical protein